MYKEINPFVRFGHFRKNFLLMLYVLPKKKNPLFCLDFHIPFADKKLLLFRDNDVRGNKKVCCVCLFAFGRTGTIIYYHPTEIPSPKKSEV